VDERGAIGDPARRRLHFFVERRMGHDPRQQPFLAGPARAEEPSFQQDLQRGRMTDQFHQRRDLRKGHGDAEALHRRAEPAAFAGDAVGTVRYTRDQAPISARPTMTLWFAAISWMMRSTSVSAPSSAAVAMPSRSMSAASTTA
jgi:hypothetical protein